MESSAEDLAVGRVEPLVSHPADSGTEAFPAERGREEERERGGRLWFAVVVISLLNI